MASRRITRKDAAKVLQVVDAGLVSGLGYPTLGHMCVEAAVCFAFGLPHSDKPDCVAPVLQSLKITLNDAFWSSPIARAKGLRRLALAQLGSAGALNEEEFRKRIVDYALRVSTPKALRCAASICLNAPHKQKLLEAANKCETEGSQKAALEARDTAVPAFADASASASAVYASRAAIAAADAYACIVASAYYAATAARAAAETVAAAANYHHAARDQALSEYAEAIVGILIDMKAPGTRFLDLAPLEVA